MSKRIAVQMLVGRNQEPFLRYAIRSVNWVDYFTVCNTAPESNWGKINKDIVFREIPSNKLHYSELQPDENEHFSFADARNECLDMTEENDLVFIVDADDVHYNCWQPISRELTEWADSVTAYFYHLMVYNNIYQYVQPREIIYTNYSGTRWQKGVHETLINAKTNPVTTHYHYVHYGYVKPQREVFRRWKFYSDLEGDFNHYKGQNPDTILSDRISVCDELPAEHPEAIRRFIRENYEDCPRGDLRNSPPKSGHYGQQKVGLVLLTMNDEDLIDECLDSLSQTARPPDFSVLAIDCNSDDDSIEKLQEWQAKKVFELQIVGADTYTSLTESLNYGFDFFRQQEEYEYVGWIHPDMTFIQTTWLQNLWKVLQEHEDIGKICSANFRDAMPDELIPGHEQCYILRKNILHKIGLFDESFIGIGGYEDWDYNKRIMEHQGPAGFYRVMITPNSWVQHEGMVTRSRRDTRPEQIANSKYYYEKWNTYNPPC